MDCVADNNKVSEMIEELADSIIRDSIELSNCAIVGIQTRGVYIADRICRIIKDKTGQSPESGVLDITLYRDDISSRRILPLVRETAIDFDVSSKIIFLIDDVLFTGRTIKAALDSITSFGRPQAIRLAVLVDRGNRELPIQPDYVGMILETELNDKITVKMQECDNEDIIEIESV